MLTLPARLHAPQNNTSTLTQTVLIVRRTATLVLRLDAQTVRAASNSCKTVLVQHRVVLNNIELRIIHAQTAQKIVTLALLQDVQHAQPVLSFLRTKIASPFVHQLNIAPKTNRVSTVHQTVNLAQLQAVQFVPLDSKSHQTKRVNQYVP